jgi:hypothetical protein
MPTEMAFAIACILNFNIDQSQPIDSLLLRGIELVHHEQFEEVFTLFNTVIANASREPAGCFFRAMAYYNLKAESTTLAFFTTSGAGMMRL